MKMSSKVKTHWTKSSVSTFLRDSIAALDATAVLWPKYLELFILRKIILNFFQLFIK